MSVESSFSLAPDNQPPLSSSPAHHPTLPWSNGIPSPPRILVPPPTLINDVITPYNRSASSRIWAVSAQSLNYQDSLNSKASISYSQLLANSGILPTSLQDWRYESRREAQQILPHLYLGPLSAAKDLDYIRRENITLLIAVRNSVTARANLLNASTELNKDPELAKTVRFESVDVSGNPELIAAFPIASRLIDQHLYRNVPNDFIKRKPAAEGGAPIYPPNPGKTLLYCESGNERSAAVAAAYIMQYIGCSAVQAIQVIQGRRFCVCFDDAMKYLLTGYEPIWLARRDVELQQLQQQQQQQHHQQDNGNGAFAQSNGGGSSAMNIAFPVPQSISSKKSKRPIEEAYDDQMMDGNAEGDNPDHDMARFEKREGVAPFMDESDLSVMMVDDL